MTDISVIVAAYEAAGTIGRALDSIAAQTLKPVEVVVVDDGSADATAAIARDVSKAWADNKNGIRLRIFRSDQNLGAGAARNRAIEESTGQIMAFLDADDEWMPGKLERSMAHLEGGALALVAHDYLAGPDLNAATVHCAQRFREGSDPFTALYRKGYISTSTVVARRDAVLKAGGFDPQLLNAQDFDLWLAMLRHADTPFAVFDDALMRYHATPGSIMSYTGRRLRCGHTIAVRFFPDLKTRPGVALISLWFRIAALHMEAFRAYMAQGEIGRSLISAWALPWRLLMATASCLFIDPAPRGPFLDLPTDKNNEA